MNDANGLATARVESIPTGSRVSDAQILAALYASGAVQTGHFVLPSGRHSDTYIQCARVLEQPRLTARLAQEAVARLPQGLEVDLVAAPAVGGILFGFAVAAALDRPMIFSERVAGQMQFRRSFTVPAAARVLIAEDVVTTGGSVKELLELVRAAGAEAAGIVSLINRGEDPGFGLPYFPLLSIPTPSWSPEQCQLCQLGEEPQSPGSRRLGK